LEHYVGLLRRYSYCIYCFFVANGKSAKLDVDESFFFVSGSVPDAAALSHIQESVTRVTDFDYVRADILFRHESDCGAIRG